MTRDGVAQTRTWNYEASTQRLVSTTAPESGTTTYSYYSPSGLLLSRTDAKGQRTEYVYDPLRRPIQVNR